MTDDEMIELTVDKSKVALIFFGSIAFVAMGVFSVNDGTERGWFMGWLGIILSVLGFFGSLLLMLTPNSFSLKIDKNGVEMKSIFWRRATKLFEWNDVNGFFLGITKIGNTKYIGIKYSESYKKLQTARKLAVFTGYEGVVPHNFYNRSAEEICELLNDSKQKWGGAGSGASFCVAPEKEEAKPSTVP